MRAAVSAATIAASLLTGGAGWSACLPGQTRNCVNLDLVPQITRQIVSGEANTVTAKPIPPADDASKPYTGPTVGAAPGVRRAPMVGYRWAID